MTHKLYQDDPYMAEFEARVDHTDGEWVALDRTALYPGGGGQNKDQGTIDGLDVSDSRVKDRIEHRVPGHKFSIGQVVHCRVDWARRYDLMRSHTGEHMLFSALSRRTEIELVKISLTPEKRSLIVKGDIDWDLIKDALQEVNGLILKGQEVRAEVLSKNCVDGSRTRIKMDRIHGDSVRVISIGDYDEAACTGVHVHNTREIGFLMITKFTSAKPVGDWEIEFQIGEAAARSSSSFAVEMLRASEILGSNPQDFRVAFENRESEHRKAMESLKQYSKVVLNALEPNLVGETKVYAAHFRGIDRKLLMDKATDIVSGTCSIAILVSEEDKSFLVLSRSPDQDIDCVSIVNEVLSEFGGRGGGKAGFATGGTPGAVEGGIIISKVLQHIGLKGK
ncbi:MAG: alanyl-tRNA editing protein [Methanomassiliicoccales archaeon]|nr:alanyl-tRNA editing protein [Methanomassiliicoccales archaeon]